MTLRKRRRTRAPVGQRLASDRPIACMWIRRHGPPVPSVDPYPWPGALSFLQCSLRLGRRESTSRSGAEAVPRFKLYQRAWQRSPLSSGSVRGTLEQLDR
jgi:hypothetical protein